MLIQGATGVGAVGFEIDDEQFDSNVLKAMHVDEISLAIKSDPLLVLLGQTQYNKLGARKACHVREKLRIMGRLKLVLRRNTGKVSASIEEFINPMHFDTCVQGVKSLAEETDQLSLSGTKTFKKPSLALKAGHLLRKIAELKKGQGIRNKDDTLKVAAADFIELYNTEWSDKISGIAHQNIKELHFNKETILPLTADLQKLTKYLEEETTAMTTKILNHKSAELWRKLAELTLTRLILFNKRRAEEPAQMLVERFKQRPINRNTNEELLQSLQPIEKHLMKCMDMVEVLGKKNRKVPILMTQTMLAAVSALVSTRDAVGIPKENPFVFAVGENGHLRGCATIKRTVESCKDDIKYPELITSTKLRKYMATVSQVFNLSTGQLEELAGHMGHELSVHRQYYRLQEDVVEIAKVSKLLLTVEKGNAHQFAGMSLDDIQLDGKCR
ncbi:uncharacterized protein LOC110455631 [Mizuhopecten yessoensis]|uniref:uncharacterized protein LOC110455631 n=1 Tax=Mizuhopecten yessoensis TaxID=6573 RepID=UPI000B45E2CA|nr:uncharacterized protein LOC110455631 [Mizuhopecten yessoensis]